MGVPFTHTKPFQPVPLEQRPSGHRHPVDTGNCTQMPATSSPLAEPEAGERQHRGRSAGPMKSRLTVGEPLEAPDEQARGEMHDEAERHLGRDQRAHQALPAVRVRAALQSGGRPHRGRAQSGRQRKQERRGERQRALKVNARHRPQGRGGPARRGG